MTHASAIGMTGTGVPQSAKSKHSVLLQPNGAAESAFATWMAMLFPKTPELTSTPDKMGSPLAVTGKTKPVHDTPSTPLDAHHGMSRCVVAKQKVVPGSGAPQSILPSERAIASHSATAANPPVHRPRSTVSNNGSINKTVLEPKHMAEVSVKDVTHKAATTSAVPPLDAQAFEIAARVHAVATSRSSVHAPRAETVSSQRLTDPVTNRAMDPLPNVQPNVSSELPSKPSSSQSWGVEPSVKVMVNERLSTAEQARPNSNQSQYRDKGHDHQSDLSGSTHAVKTNRWSQFQTETQNAASMPSVTTPAGFHPPKADSAAAVHIDEPGWTSQLAQAMGQHRTSSQGELRVKVHPEGLGDLVITAVQGHDGIKVHVDASNQAVANLLTQSSTELRDSIRLQGVDVSSVMISYGQSSAGGGQAGNPGRDGREFEGLQPIPKVVESKGTTSVAPREARSGNASSRSLISVRV